MKMIPPGVPRERGNGYPTGDGKPMAETDLHRNIMFALIETLKDHFAADPMVYVTGNLLVFYREGDRRRHLSPDVMVVRGVEMRERLNYLVWEEKTPDVVIEVTSSSTRREDIGRKLELYRDVMRVKEYLLFDPNGDWLDPRLLGHRLRGGRYVRIRPTAEGRIPSQVLGLQLEREGNWVYLFDPTTGQRLRTPREGRDDERHRADAEHQARLAAEAEAARLRDELAALRRRLGDG